MSEHNPVSIPEDDLVEWWRAHAAHLRGDPYDICIPAFNGVSYAEVEVDDVAAVSGIGSSGRRTADRDCWPETTLVQDGTRVFVNVSELAHSRECSETSCIAVWHRSSERQRAFGERTFVFAMSPVVGASSPTPTLVPMDICVGRLKHLRHTGVSVDELPAVYDVEPLTADDLRAQRTPRVEPIDAAQYVR